MRITSRRLTELIADVCPDRGRRTGFEDAIQLDSGLLVEGAQHIRGTGHSIQEETVQFRFDTSVRRVDTPALIRYGRAASRGWKMNFSFYMPRRKRSSASSSMNASGSVG